MKKLLALVLCLCMVLPAVALADDDVVELTFWIRTSDAFVEDQVAAYMADHPNVKVNVEAVGAGYADLRTKFSLGIQGDELPDLSIAGWSGIGTLFDAGAIADVKEIPGVDGLMDEMVESFSQRCLYKDSYVVAIPYQVSAPVMYYNKTMLDSLGLKVPETFTELMEIGAQCVQKDANGSTTVYGFNTMDDINWYLLPMIYNFGGSFFDDAFNCQLNTEATQKVYTWWADMVKQGIMPANQPATTQEDFVNGNLAFFFGSCASYASVKAAVGSNFETGVAFFPGEESQQVNLGGNGIVIFTKDEDKQAAIVDLVSYLLAPEQLQAVMEKGYLPVTKTTLASDYAATAAAEDPNWQVIYDQVQRITVFIQHPAYAKATSLLKDLASQIEADPEADVAALVAEMQQEIDEYMEDYE